jgi:pimeloyl-ACP methyl ester carboxylesterase
VGRLEGGQRRLTSDQLRCGGRVALVSMADFGNRAVEGWVRPLIGRAESRRDLTAYLRGARPGRLERAAERAGGFDRPVLVLWGADDRVMPHADGRRLATLFPRGGH